MADKFKKNPTMTSPKGTFKWPRLNEPDTKFKEEGEYSVKVVMNPTDKGVQELIDAIDEAAAASLAFAQDKAETPAKAKKWETKYLPYADVEDEDGEPTGEVEVKFTMKASGVNRRTGKAWTRKPAIFDAQGTPLTDAPAIWGGTVGKINFEIIPYSPTPQVGASVKLGLNAVQIIELVSGGTSASASSFGFGAEDGGFVAADDDEDDDDVAEATESDAVETEAGGDDEDPFT